MSGDYHVVVNDLGTSRVVLGIHAGSIETGTSELTRAIAGEDVGGTDYSSYRFEGHNLDGVTNQVLHITSANFDEPRAVSLVTQASTALSVHGFNDGTSVQVTCVGGRDIARRDEVIKRLRAAGFAAEVAGTDAPCASYAGTNAANIVNRGTSGGGVQLEVSRHQREALFGTFTAAQRWNTRNARFHGYVKAVRAALNARL